MNARDTQIDFGEAEVTQIIDAAIAEIDPEDLGDDFEKFHHLMSRVARGSMCEVYSAYLPRKDVDSGALDHEVRCIVDSYVITYGYTFANASYITVAVAEVLIGVADRVYRRLAEIHQEASESTLATVAENMIVDALPYVGLAN